jgi:hypothetical protein
MRYSDSELFDITEEQWQKWLDAKSTPREFFSFCIDRLEFLIELSLVDNKIGTDADHLMNYRLKSVRFYRKKIGEK